VGKKRGHSNKHVGTASPSEKASYSELRLTSEEFDMSDLSDDDCSTNNQLFKIEKKI